MDNSRFKFRAWCYRDEMMYYNIQHGITFDDGSRYSFENFLELSCQDETDYHRWELMQFTGLLDKAGKEIYEGDIIRFYHLGDIIGEKVGEIRYSNQHASFYVGTKNKYGVKIAILNALSWYYEEKDIEETRVEIIGNIYETPELWRTNQKLS